MTPKRNAEARQVVDALLDAELAIRAFQAPEITQGHEGETTCLTCPWCDGDLPTDGGVIEIDTDTRRNSATYDLPAHDPHLSVGQGDSEYTTLYYTTSCCGLPVAVPNEWTVTWG